MKPETWLWSKHTAAINARRSFMLAFVIFAVIAAYIVVSSHYINQFLPAEDRGIALANQILALVVMAVALAIILRQGVKGIAEAHGQIRKIVENMSDYFHVVDRNWNYTFINNKLAELFHQSPQEFIGKSVWDFVPASIQPELRRRYAEVRTTGLPQRLDIYVKETGTWTDIQVYPNGSGLAVFFQDITDRKRAEELLQESHRSFKAIVDSAMDGVASLDAQQNIILFNRAAEAMFQVKADDMIGQPVTTLMPERFRPSHANHVRNFGATSVTTRRMGSLGEVYGLRADGSEFPMEVSISRTGEEGSRIYTAIIRDITEKKRAQKRLDQKIRQQVALAQFSMSSLNTQDPATLFNTASNFARANLDADYCTIVDVDQANNTVRIVATSGWVAEGRRTIAIDEIASEALVPRLLRARGVVRFTDISNDPALSADDTLARLGAQSGLGLALQAMNDHVGMIFVMAKDIRTFSDDDAEFLQTLSNIVVRARESDIVLNTLRLRDRALESISQGITISDQTAPDRPILYTNAAFARMTGYSVKEILGLPARHFMAPDAPAGVLDQFALIRAKKRTASLDTRTRRRDGTSFMDHVDVSPILNTDGDLIHYVTVHEDVTEARQREEQLHEAQKMEAVGQLTGGVAHDFNNLLTVVRANAEDMRKEFDKDPILLEQTDMILQATERGATLIRQMMAFARKQELDPENIDLNAMMEPFVRLVRRAFQENISIVVKCEPGVPMIRVDPGRLETAVLNMMLNARDAMPEGGTITVETALQKLDKTYTRHNADIRPGTYAMLAITDTGVGMTKDVAEKAFQPFFTTKEVGQGTGLGLSMVYGFVKQSGGHAKIYSEPGIGTTIKVYLPLAQGVAVAAPTAASIRIQAGAASGSILVVEDDDLVRKSVSQRLTRMGYTISTAEHAAAAIQELEKNPNIDLVFTDVIMPGSQTGADLAREIKLRWPSIQILMTSGYTAASALGKVKMPEGIPLLSKPYSVEELIKALNNAMGK